MKLQYFALVLLASFMPVCCFSQEAAPSPVAVQRLAREVVALTNVERAKTGLPPLKFQENLRVAACWLAQDMAEKNYFSHVDKQGRDIDPRLPSCGYRRYHGIGENIAAGQATPVEALAEWMKSPAHRENILSKDWNEMGAGYSYTYESKFQHYWVQDFGARYNVLPVVINMEQPETKTAQVQLYIYGDGWAQQMRLSNDGKEWTPWEAYITNRNWTLTDGGGERTVYVELRNGEVVRRDQDTIILQPQAAVKPPQ